MRFYRATSFIFPRHYTARIFTISFGAVHIPLITYLVLEAIRGHWDWPTFTVLLIATVIGSGFAIAGLAGLLRPVSVATRGMRAILCRCGCDVVAPCGAGRHSEVEGAFANPEIIVEHLVA